jgi:transposase-like protein
MAARPGSDLRAGTPWSAQLIELEVAASVGTNLHERSEERSGYRNGSRPQLLTTQVGEILLSIPKLRASSFFPMILELGGGSIRRCMR